MENTIEVCQTKRCPKCLNDKPHSDYNFFFDKRRRANRIGNYCRDCLKELRRANAKQLYNRRKHKRKAYDEKYKALPAKREKLRQQFKKYRDELPDSYVAVYISRVTSLTVAEAKQNTDLIEVYRARLKLYRKLKQLKDEKQIV